MTSKEQDKISKVVIIGGGPCGLVAAILLSKIIKEVVVLEKEKFPVDKVCGEGLMPRAVDFLKDENILDQNFLNDKNNYYYFEGINFAHQNICLEGKFPKNSRGMGIKRTVLSQLLFNKARDSGVVIKTSSKVVDIKTGVRPFVTFMTEQSVSNNSNVMSIIEADLVLLCDGHSSLLKQKLEIKRQLLYPQILKRKGEFPLRLGAREHYTIRPWSNKVEVLWGDGIEAYITPLSSDKIGITWLFNAKQMKPGSDSEIFLKYFPSLKEKLKNAISLNDFLVFGPMGLKSNRGSLGKICLLGDSFSFYDGITGEGLASAFNECQLLLKALKEYQNDKIKNIDECFCYFEEERKRNLDLTVNHCSFVLFLSSSKLIKKIVFLFLNEFPSVFQKMLAINVQGEKLVFKNFF